ncbi:MAG TPA: hypothetical protein VFQ91_09145 [Bryobacteraceae bacterium]|nr:hypothetical protein [Bryobacteraceae bacterium]
MSFFPRGQGPWLLWTPVTAITVAAGVEPYVAEDMMRWLLAAVFLVSALPAFGMSIHARRQPRRRELEVRTGRELYRRPVHSALWLRAEAWGAAYLALAVWITARAY